MTSFRAQLRRRQWHTLLSFYTQGAFPPDFSAIGVTIECILARFNRKNVKVYQSIQELLLKAVAGKDHEELGKKHRKSASVMVTPKKCKFLQLCEHQLSVKVTPTWCTFTPQ